jgi:MFS family permease
MVASCKCDGLKAWILACTLISNSAYATIAPFLPIEIHNKGVATLWLAPIFAIYPVGIVVFSPFVSRLVSCLGAANVLALGMAGMEISLTCLGLLLFSNSIHVTIGFSLVIRFVQGVASAIIQTICYILTINEYPKNDQEHIIGLMEAMTGVGILYGPLIGSALHTVTNSESTFLVL